MRNVTITEARQHQLEIRFQTLFSHQHLEEDLCRLFRYGDSRVDVILDFLKKNDLPELRQLCQVRLINVKALGKDLQVLRKHDFKHMLKYSLRKRELVYVKDVEPESKVDEDGHGLKEMELKCEHPESKVDADEDGHDPKEMKIIKQ
ncbi:hypothetical protein Tco_0669904 [Tanacetum coccineum]